jgi:predicted nucleic acid-binding protein
MYKKVFLDTNILIDRFDVNRPFYRYSYKTYEYLLKNEYQIYTSCDVITTIYYILSKIDKKLALKNIREINKTLKVIEFSNDEVEKTCSLMLEDKRYRDLEDTMQYILAKKYKCDLIISNDKNFFSADIDIYSSEEFYKKYIKDES